jgi:hypothetical protein
MHTTPPLPTSLRPYPEPYLWILIISKGKKATFSSCPPNTQSLMQTHPPKRAFYPPNTITLSVQNKGKDIKSGSRCRTLCTDKRGRNSTSLLLASLRALILLAGLALTSISLYTTDRACGTSWRLRRRRHRHAGHEAGVPSPSGYGWETTCNKGRIADDRPGCGTGSIGGLSRN